MFTWRTSTQRRAGQLRRDRYGSERGRRLRDTKNRDGGTLLLPRTAFAALVDAVKADRLR
ncbi:DUF397 domain-containing protein [Actinoalloteichus caeruleus]|uniref:DUF397 domain-containing protein n=1 Tax=Actinoalloteichus cyanogriseus TaxID=2893586 RepID=UPI000AC4FAE8|nr:DUF397 domain-containing protein [Actinoalloteichus caeruleus]